MGDGDERRRALAATPADAVVAEPVELGGELGGELGHDPLGTVEVRRAVGAMRAGRTGWAGWAGRSGVRRHGASLAAADCTAIAWPSQVIASTSPAARGRAEVRFPQA
ncbi:hypothetical protein GCM10009574_034050 [Streptomyces asiaticus]